MGDFHVVDEKEVLEGKTTDIYFENTRTVLRSINKNRTNVIADFTVSRLPGDWSWAVFCGLEEIINLMKGKKVNIRALPEGTIFRNRTRNGILVPVMAIEGPYYDFCVYETPILGLMCQASGIATRTARLRSLAGDSQLLSFGVRRVHPVISPMVDRSAFIGGCDSVSCIASAERLGLEPKGTMPHALSIMAGDPADGFKAFDKHLPKKIPRIALVDTYQDEVREAITAAETVPGLEGVRLDTPASRRGDLAQIVQELRWELDIRGYDKVKIYVSGGINENSIQRLKNAGVHGFGIGTTIVNAPVLDIAMDIVEMEGKPVAKRGKFSGKKTVLRCPECYELEVVIGRGGPVPKCFQCDVELKEVMQNYMTKGIVKGRLPGVNEIRNYLLEQLQHYKVDA